ncbi:MAG: undecaprenyl-diphosphate phosphatase [Anaerolineae bacterium]|nr:undecaprenyl-diphosphate phosphatase [Anaerolineae bacterium]
MNVFEALLLGLIQGVTEFLPISSSGHLILIPAIFNLPLPTLSLVAVAHIGTLVAVLIYFRQDLSQIIRGVATGLRKGKPLENTHARLGWYIVAASIPIVVAGLLLSDFLEAVFDSPSAAAFFLLVTAVILVIGERLYSGQKKLAHMSWLDTMIIGFVQVLALLPGISRSGSTITAGLWRELDRTDAARFSFLLGIPAILGAGILGLADILAADDLAAQLPVIVTVFLTAAVSGYACIYFLLYWLRQHSLYLFAVYCAVLGGFYLLVYPA